MRRPKKGEKVWSEMWKKTSLGRGNNKNKSPEVVGYMHKEKRGSQLCWSRVIMEGYSSRLTET